MKDIKNDFNSEYLILSPDIYKSLLEMPGFISNPTIGRIQEEPAKITRWKELLE